MESRNIVYFRIGFMKNTLKIMLLIIGFGFLIYGLYNLLASGPDSELQKQLYAMLGVGILFLLAGFSLGKRK